jgi:four helix bundle protein
MAGSILLPRTKTFALNIISLVGRLPKTTEGKVLGHQLLRSGTSIGANYREACRARSKAEFISKIGDCLKEADETLYWLELLGEGRIVGYEDLQHLLRDADEITAMLVASLNTAKGVRS